VIASYQISRFRGMGGDGSIVVFVRGKKDPGQNWIYPWDNEICFCYDPIYMQVRMRLEMWHLQLVGSGVSWVCQVYLVESLEFLLGIF